MSVVVEVEDDGVAGVKDDCCGVVVVVVCVGEEAGVVDAFVGVEGGV